MSFEEQTVGGLLVARKDAFELLEEEGVRQKPLRLEETFVMHAASHLLTEAETFYGLQVADMTQLRHISVYNILHAFRDRYRLLTSRLEDQALRRGRQRMLYSPTELGARTLQLFQN
jgi:hypothetical protein